MTNSSTTTQSDTQLPHDPDGKNSDRSLWAEEAVLAFQHKSGSDDEDVLGDLLAALMHWADRSNYDFEAALFRAQGQYEEETAERPA